QPPSGVLRHVDAPRTAAPLATANGMRGRELVVLVGGFQSCACDGTFDALVKRLTDAGFDVRRFGADPRYPYDTFGPIAPSATNLRDEIRAVAPSYGGVHIVTHSMGGAVADAAFAKGLSRPDGVISYVAWSAPHNGSDAARMSEAAKAAGGADTAVRETARELGFTTDASAVRDLSTARASSAPAGVIRLDLRMATDVLVTDRDSRLPDVETRILDGALEGHAGILTDPRAIDLTVRTITTRRVPPEDRPRVGVRLLEHKSRLIGGVVLVALCALAAALCLWGLCRRPLAPYVDPIVARAVALRRRLRP
ncbi:MAG: hypothetical protein AAB295_10260, partial [Chloroflexota bacterium]